MSVFLIQTSATKITTNDEYAATDYTTGPRFCDDILTHHTYVNAIPYWQTDAYDRRDAWQTVAPGDTALLYCTSLVDAHSACLSHVLPITAVERTDEAALLRLDTPVECTPKLSYQEIHRLVDQGHFSPRMAYCGQQGFNFTETDPQDLDAVQERTSPTTGTWP